MSNKENNSSLKFSVSICVYEKDNPQWFNKAIESVLKQSLPPNEIVLVVDGPVSNELNEIIRIYETREIFKVIRLEKNQGHGNARRVGLEACSFDLVALMDADDISDMDRFQKQIQVFSNDKNVSVVGGNISEFINEEQNIIGYRVLPSYHEDLVVYLKKRCPFNQVTVMFKKSDVERAGGYVDWYCEEDYYLWLRMYEANMKFYNLQDVLVNVRVGKEMYNRRGGWKYFKSEARLQKYMRRKKIIGIGTYYINIIKRFILQILLTNKLRGWIFKKFARTKNFTGKKV